MGSDLYPLIALLVATLIFLWHLLRRLFPPAWMEVLADYQIVSSYTGSKDSLFRSHMLKLQYEVGGRSFEKLAPVRFSPGSLEWQVISQPDNHIARSKLLIRVHPRKPQRIYYQKSPLSYFLVPLAVLGLMWAGLLPYLTTKDYWGDGWR